MLHHHGAVPGNGARQFSNPELQKGTIPFQSLPYPTPTFAKLLALGTYVLHLLIASFYLALLLIRLLHKLTQFANLLEN